MKNSPAVTNTEQLLDAGRAFANFQTFQMEWDCEFPAWMEVEISDRMLTEGLGDGEDPLRRSIIDIVESQLEPARARYLLNFLAQLEQVHAHTFTVKAITAGYKNLGIDDWDKAGFAFIMGHWPLWRDYEDKAGLESAFENLQVTMATNGRLSEKDMDDAGVPRILPEHKMRERKSVDVRQLGEDYACLPNHPGVIAHEKKKSTDREVEAQRVDTFKVGRCVLVLLEGVWIRAIVKPRPQGTTPGVRKLTFQEPPHAGNFILVFRVEEWVYIAQQEMDKVWAPSAEKYNWKAMDAEVAESKAEDVVDVVVPQDLVPPQFPEVAEAKAEDIVMPLPPVATKC